MNTNETITMIDQAIEAVTKAKQELEDSYLEYRISMGADPFPERKTPKPMNFRKLQQGLA